MSSPGAEAGEPGRAVKTCETSEPPGTTGPGDTIEAAGSLAASGEPCDGIAEALIRPIIVAIGAMLRQQNPVAR